jgi:hypothetical protein
MKDEKNIIDYKKRFCNTLVGKWTTIEGTFFMMSDFFEFEQNGKGLWLQSSGSGEQTVYFEWKIETPFIVNIMETKTEYSILGVVEESFENELDERSWITQEYEFKVIKNDCGEQVALCNIGSEHFYYATNRIGFSTNF